MTEVRVWGTASGWLRWIVLWNWLWLHWEAGNKILIGHASCFQTWVPLVIFFKYTALQKLNFKMSDGFGRCANSFFDNSLIALHSFSFAQKIKDHSSLLSVCSIYKSEGPSSASHPHLATSRPFLTASTRTLNLNTVRDCRCRVLFQVVFSSAEWFGTEFRESASILVPRTGIPRYFLFC